MMRTLTIAESGHERTPMLMMGVLSYLSAKGKKYQKVISTIMPPEFWKEIFPNISEKELVRLTTSASLFFIVEGDDVVELMKKKVTEVNAYYKDNMQGWKNCLYSSPSKEVAEKEIGILIKYVSQGRK